MEEFQFDSEELIAAGKYPAKAKKIIFMMDSDDMDRALMKSDTCEISMPGLELQVSYIILFW